MPSAFITGMSGQFYRQFALTIAGATVISLTVSLTLSPALCALLLKPHRRSASAAGWWERPIHGFFGCFNRGFDKLAQGYGWLVCACGSLHRDHAADLCRRHRASASTSSANAARLHPAGRSRLPDRGGAVAARRVARRAPTRCSDGSSRPSLKTPGVVGAVNIVGFSGATFTNAPNAGAAFLVLDSFEKRAKDPNQSAAGFQRALFGKFAAIQEAHDLRRCAAAGAWASATPAASA